MRRSRWTSKGWWRWQYRKRRDAIVRFSKTCRGQFRRWFPTKLSDDQLYAQFQADVDFVQKHITDAFRHRKMFRDTTDILQQNQRLNMSPDAGYWYEWLRTVYAHYIVMAVRRELDRGADAPNLFRLLHEIARQPQVLSRARYKALLPQSDLTREFGINFWDRPFTEMAGPGDFIDTAIVKRDLDELDRQAKLVILYANRIVAHRTPQSVPTTLRHVNDSLETIERILQKYYVLLTGRTLIAAEPSVLVTWQRAFREAWIV